MPYYLASSPNPAEAGVNEIKTWLGSFITRPDFLTNPPPKLSDLRVGLRCGVREILLHLDPELEAEIHRAGEPQHNIRTDQDDFFEAREYVFEDIQGDRSLYLTRADAMRWLELVREEIWWMNNEIRRLECHMKIAFELKLNRCRGSFWYRPSQRKEPPFSVVPVVEEDEAEENQVMAEDEAEENQVMTEAEAEENQVMTEADGEDQVMLEVGEAPEWVKMQKERSQSPERNIKAEMEDETPMKKIKTEVEDETMVDDEMEDGELKEQDEDIDEKDETLTKEDSLSPTPETKTETEAETETETETETGAEQSEDESAQSESETPPSGWGVLSLFRS